MSIDSFPKGAREGRDLKSDYEAYLTLGGEAEIVPSVATDSSDTVDHHYPAIFSPADADGVKSYLDTIKNEPDPLAAGSELVIDEHITINGVEPEFTITPQIRGQLRAYRNIARLENEEAAARAAEEAKKSTLWGRFKGLFNQKKPDTRTLKEHVADERAADILRAAEKFEQAPATLTREEKRLLGLEERVVVSGEVPAVTQARKKLYDNPATLSDKDISLLSAGEKNQYKKWQATIVMLKHDRRAKAKEKLHTNPALLTPGDVLSLDSQDQEHYGDWYSTHAL